MLRMHSELKHFVQLWFCHVAQQSVWICLKIVQDTCGYTWRSGYSCVYEHLSGDIDDLFFGWGFLDYFNGWFPDCTHRIWHFRDDFQSLVVVLQIRRRALASVFLFFDEVIVGDYEHPGLVLVIGLSVSGGAFDLEYFFSIFGVGGGNYDVADFLFISDTPGSVLIMVSGGESVSGVGFIFFIRVPVIVVCSFVHVFFICWFYKCDW